MLYAVRGHWDSFMPSPLPLIPRVILKLLDEEVELLAPHWPRQPWFADLVTLSVNRS